MAALTTVICFALIAVAAAANGLKQSRMSTDPFPEINDEFLRNLSKHYDNPKSPELKTEDGIVHDCTQYLLELERKQGREPTEQSLRFHTLSYLDTVYAAGEPDPEKRRKILLDNLNINLGVMYGLKEDLEKCSVTPITEPPIEELIAEVQQPGFVGSVRGVPGVNYPNYTEVPLTSFSCSGKEYIPGFYADLETRCQVFHVCYDHRRESFLCPIGTVFNQPILACDYWYNSNCSQAPHYYDVNADKDATETPEEAKDDIEEMITTIIEQEKPALPHFHIKTKDSHVEAELEQVFQFLPVKAKVVEFTPEPEPIATTPHPVVKPKLVVPIPPVVEPKLIVPPVKVAERAVPIESIADIAMAKVVAAKAVPLLKAKAVGKAKIKLAAAAAAVPVIKAKIAAEAIPVVKSKVADVVKMKREIASAMPVVKAKVATTVPLFKAKVAAKKIPVVKATLAVDAKLMAAKKAKKAMAIPLIKSKIMISPLTKKALAVGYMKLLKAKKFGLLG